jgi:hypothetical protein
MKKPTSLDCGVGGYSEYRPLDSSQSLTKTDWTCNPFALSLSTPSIRTTVELTPKGREKGAFLSEFH